MAFSHASSAPQKRRASGSPRAPALVTLGAGALPIEDLLRLMLGTRAQPAELGMLAHALALRGPAQRAALLAHPHGGAVLAALEVGRRAWQMPAERQRVRGPADVAAIVRPRAVSADGVHPTPAAVEASHHALVLDAALAVARLCPQTGLQPAEVLRDTLSAGCTRVVLAVACADLVRPGAVEIAAAQHLQAAAETVGVALVDVVLVSDQGVQSLVRAGHLFSVEPRYGVRGADSASEAAAG